MIRHLFAVATATAVAVAPVAGFAQQPAPSGATATYSDTLPKHHAAAKTSSENGTSSKKVNGKSVSKKPTGKKLAAKTSAGKKTHKTSKSRKAISGKADKSSG